MNEVFTRPSKVTLDERDWAFEVFHFKEDAVRSAFIQYWPE
jgi:hypothetical protein